MKLRTKTILAVLAVFTSLVTTATPASATTYPVSGVLSAGRLILSMYVGTLAYNVPGDLPACSDSSTTMEFDDEGDGDPTDAVQDFTLQFKEPAGHPVSGWPWYQLDITGSAAGPFPWNSSTGAFGPVTVTMDVELRELEADGCIEGETFCHGTMTVQFSGTTRHGLVGPTPGSGGPVWVTGATSVPLTVDQTSCDYPWYLFFYGGVDATLGVQPWTNPGEPGARFVT